MVTKAKKTKSIPLTKIENPDVKILIGQEELKPITHVEIRQKSYLEQQSKFFNTHQTKSVDFRIEQLKKLRSAIIDYEEKIYDALYKDMGKSKETAYLTENGFNLFEISHVIKNLKKWNKSTKVKSIWFFPMSNAFIQKEPYGKVLVISPWNYPFALTMSPLIGAIAAGNCVTLKPSEHASHTAKVISDMITQYFDAGYIQVIQGGVETTQELLNDNFDYICFTGSEHVGKIVMGAAAKKLIPVTLELGGKSPCIIDKNCNIEKTVARIVGGKFINAGQTCTAPDYVLVHKDVKDSVIEKLKEKITKYYGTDIKKSKDYQRVINKQHFHRLKELLSDTKILFGGQTDEKTLYIAPTLVEVKNENSKILKEEIFGPILPIIEYSSDIEMVDYINARPKPLSLYLFTNDKSLQQKVLNETSSGGVCINDALLQYTNINLPFGGVGSSGMGKYHGKASFDTFSNTKSIMKNTVLLDLPSRYPPTNKNTLPMLKKLLK